MSVAGVGKAIISSAVQSTDRFNDYVGARHIGGARLISGGVQAFAYGRAAELVGSQALEDLAKTVEKFKAQDIANGIGYTMLTAAEGAATAMLATHAVAAVVTAASPSLADRLEK